MSFADLFRTKSIEKIQADAAGGFGKHDATKENHLRRTLGLFDLTLMGIAAIVGAGIFSMIGKASYEGGPAVIFLFIFTAIACAFSALCYAEFASRLPVAGSAYTYSYASFGEIIAWIIGWDLIVEYAIGNIAVAISWSDYFTGLLSGLGINIPPNLTMDFLTAKRGFAAVSEELAKGTTLEVLQSGCDAAKAAVNCGQIEAYQAWANAPHFGGLPLVADIPALLITVLMSSLVYVGIRESKFASNIMTVLKLAVILLVIVVGAFYVKPENWSSFAPHGAEGVLKGVAAVFFAYIGFDALSTTAEECKNPSRDLPRAMILSLVVCTVLYITLALVLTGITHYSLLNVGDPLAFVFGKEGANVPWIAGVIAVSAVIAMATVFLVFQIGQPRLWMAMSRDGLLPKIFSDIHPRFKTPWFATIVAGLIVAVPALFMNLTEVTDLTSIGTLFAFTLVCGGVLIKDKEFGRENRFVPYINSKFITPILFILFIGGLFIYAGSDGFLGESYNKFFNFTPKDGETIGEAFYHKIPYLIFLTLFAATAALSFVKNLSLIPVLGLLSCGYLMSETGTTNWMRFGIWLLAGLVIYIFYGYHHSRLNQKNTTASGT